MITCTACRTAVPTWAAYRDPCPAVPHATHTLTAADIAALRPDPDASAIAAEAAYAAAYGRAPEWHGIDPARMPGADTALLEAALAVYRAAWRAVVRALEAR